MAGGEGFSIPVFPGLRTLVCQSEGSPVAVDDFDFSPPFEIVGAVVGEGLGIDVRDALVVPPVLPFGGALQLVNRFAFVLARRLRRIRQIFHLYPIDRTEAVVKGFVPSSSWVSSLAFSK